MKTESDIVEKPLAAALGKKPIKLAAANVPTKTHHKQEMEKNLVNKAFWLVVGLLFAILIVYFADMFSNATSLLTQEIIRLLATFLTFLFGYLFSTIRN